MTPQETVIVGFDDLADLLMHAQIAGLTPTAPLVAAWTRLSEAWHASVGVPPSWMDHVPANPYLPLPPDAATLSDTYRTILAYIAENVAERGYPPSLREIGDHVGWSSSSTVANHIGRLERLGWIVRDKSRPRAIRVVQPPPKEPAP